MYVTQKRGFSEAKIMLGAVDFGSPRFARGKILHEKAEPRINGSPMIHSRAEQFLMDQHKELENISRSEEGPDTSCRTARCDITARKQADSELN